MKETIYTIPISEAFEGMHTCPFCEIEKRLNDKVTEYIIGPAMMEPDIREMTNIEGFCKNHFEELKSKQKRLPLALMLESYLKKRFEDETFLLKQKGQESCFICSRRNEGFYATAKNFLKKYATDKDMKSMYQNQRGICLHHFGVLNEMCSKVLSGRNKKEFMADSLKLCRKGLANKISELEKYTASFNYTNSDRNRDVNPNATNGAIEFILGK